MVKKKIQQDILKELGLDKLPEEKQIELLNAMTELILKKITISVMEELSDKEKKEFDKVCQGKQPEEITEFLRKKIKDFDKMLDKIVKEFKEEMKANIKFLEMGLNE